MNINRELIDAQLLKYTDALDDRGWKRTQEPTPSPIKITTPKIRECEFDLCGDARELCNAVKGIEAKGLDPTAPLERFNELRDSYVH